MMNLLIKIINASAISLFVTFGFVCNGQDSKPVLAEEYEIIVDSIANGSISIEPELPEDGKYPAGTVVTITATPDKGYLLDACYHTTVDKPDRFYESTASNKYKVVVDQNKHVGASFIEKEKLENLTVTHNVVYAKPSVKELKYDVYAPKGAKNLPIVVIVHGGGWRFNNEDIMRGLARELANTGDYIVCSIDYRWMGKGDGDSIPNTIADLIGDIYGAIAHIQENAKKYGGDPLRIAITGDSAGGHLSASAANMTHMIGDRGFDKTPGVYEYMPTYMPEDKTISQVRNEIGNAIQVAAPSYGVYRCEDVKRHIYRGVNDSITWAKAIAPASNIPDVNKRQVPQLLLRGTKDELIKQDMVQEYANALKAAGQKVEFILVEGAGHAFFDWKPDPATKEIFTQYGIPYAAKMKLFFDEVFYATNKSN